MFRLRTLKNGLYQIHSKTGQAYEGTPRSVFTTAIKMGVKEQELTYAVQQLEERNDDYADFGNFGKFLYTKRDKQ